MEQVAYPREIFHCILQGFFVSFQANQFAFLPLQVIEAGLCVCI